MNPERVVGAYIVVLLLAGAGAGVVVWALYAVTCHIVREVVPAYRRRS